MGDSRGWEWINNLKVECELDSSFRKEETRVRFTEMNEVNGGNQIQHELSNVVAS
jgi:hypothetical protein